MEKPITTGDAIDWLSIQGIAGAEIELLTHDRVSEQEWQRNLRGIEAFLAWVPPERIPPTYIEPADWSGRCITHVVQPNEFLSHIVVKYNISQELLVEVNKIADPDDIKAGDTLCIPILEDQE